MFKRNGSPMVTVPAGQATPTRMTVVVPASLAKYLPVIGGVTQATRFRIRVRARSLSKGFTALKRSALIGPAIGPGGTDAADCAAEDTAGALDDLAGTDLGAEVLDDNVSPDSCAAEGDGATAGEGADDGAEPAGDDPDAAGDAPDPWDLLDAGAASDTSSE